LEASGLAPSPPADRVTLIRRVTFDLTGLPPTPEDVDRFLADDQPGAYERLVDRLLASPEYGERWAQHWLDLARFAESDGFEHDHVRPDAWKYRDWVIRALNDDMPYDEFVRQQIAGDLLYPGDEAAAVATGFALAGPDMTDINLVAERRHMILGDIAATVGSVFLGLQMGCAECHDHKYDPVSQADFYRLRAYFEDGLHVEHYKPLEHRVLHEPADAEPRETFLYVRGDFRRPGPRVEPDVPRIAPIDGEHSGQSRVALANWLTRPDNGLATRVIVNRLWQHHFGHGLVRTPSDFGRMGEPPSHPELLDWLATELPRRGWSLKSMHRLICTSATYRMRSADRMRSAEFGMRNEEQQTDNSELRTPNSELETIPHPDNRLLWRANRRRLSGEEIRDAMLAAADRLSPRTGGQGVMPPLPDELLVTLLKDQWKTSEDEEDHRRRSIYLFVRRNLRYPLFDVFDRPDTNASCPRRAESTIAPQALVLLNSEFSFACARDLAAYVLRYAGDDVTAQVDLAYRRTLGRRPMPGELSRAQEFLAARPGESPRDMPEAETPTSASTSPNADRHDAHALMYLCLALFNLNEFIYID
jgi:hypothetical protein